MQKDTVKTGIKCPECKGGGKLMKLWPLTAIAMPHELGWQRFTCWRCKGTGTLRNDDPYMGDRLPRLRPANIPITVRAPVAYTQNQIKTKMLLWP